MLPSLVNSIKPEVFISSLPTAIQSGSFSTFGKKSNTSLIFLSSFFEDKTPRGLFNITTFNSALFNTIFWLSKTTSSASETFAPKEATTPLT